VFSDSWIDSRFVENESYCGVCGDGGDLLCCEGPCRRSFHRDCVTKQDAGIRAALRSSPALLAVRHVAGLPDMDRDDWRCVACTLGAHECFACGVAGADGVDVFRCARMCGKWYHVACAARDSRTRFLAANATGGRAVAAADLQAVRRAGAAGALGGAGADPRAVAALQLADTALCVLPAAAAAADAHSASSSLALPAGASTRFVCPFHTCATCAQPFDAFHPPVYYRCHACPSAFHLPCVPKESIFDMVDVVTCPNKTAHAAKRFSSTYKSRSGLLRVGSAQQTGLALDPSMLEQLRKSSAGKRLGDAALERRLAAALAGSSGGGGGGSGNAAAAPAKGRGDAGSYSSSSAAGAASVQAAAPSSGRGKPAAATAAADKRGGPKALREAPQLEPPQLAQEQPLTHLERLSPQYYAEIRRRTEAVLAAKAYPTPEGGVAEGPTPVSQYMGVKAVQTTAGPARFISRIHYRGGLHALGTFDTEAEAAVAFDYASSYLRGHAAPSVNFRGSASLCTVEGPIDPWPTGVQAAIDAGVTDLPTPRVLPGESRRFLRGAAPSPFPPKPGSEAAAKAVRQPATGTGTSGAVGSGRRKARRTRVAALEDEEEAGGGLGEDDSDFEPPAAAGASDEDEEVEEEDDDALEDEAYEEPTAGSGKRRRHRRAAATSRTGSGGFAGGVRGGGMVPALLPPALQHQLHQQQLQARMLGLPMMPMGSAAVAASAASLMMNAFPQGMTGAAVEAFAAAMNAALAAAAAANSPRGAAAAPAGGGGIPHPPPPPQQQQQQQPRVPSPGTKTGTRLPSPGTASAAGAPLLQPGAAAVLIAAATAARGGSRWPSVLSRATPPLPAHTAGPHSPATAATSAAAALIRSGSGLGPPGGLPSVISATAAPAAPAPAMLGPSVQPPAQ